MPLGTLESLIDLVLGLATLGVAWRCLASRDLFVSVVLYVVFGLMLALVWVRLGAEDIALAEAAIGAGITGALLLDAVRHLEGRGADGERRELGPATTARSLTLASGLLLSVLAGLLVLGVTRLPQYAGGLTATVTERLPESGVAHPVTAVLLNFRAYDTLLEIVVLLLAVVAVLAVWRATDLTGPRDGTRSDAVIGALSGLLVPVIVLIGLHLLFLGTYRAGGAFQAGAILGAGSILLLLSGHRSITALPGWKLRLAVSGGLVVFVGVAMASPLTGNPMLELPGRASGTIILVIEIGAAVSIALALAALFAASHSSRTEPVAEEPTGRDS